MGIRKRFNKLFGLEDSVEQEKERFVERVNQVIFHEIDWAQTDRFHYEDLFNLLCFDLGVNGQKFARRRVPYEHLTKQARTPALRSLTKQAQIPASIRSLTKDDFEETLRALCSLYARLGDLSNERSDERQWLSNMVKAVMSQCTSDIWIRWKDGFFYPSGAEELDVALIEETLTWLNDYPHERKNYETALQHYLEQKSLGDVITNCYSSVEGIARNVLGNSRTLDSNKDELLGKTKLSHGWKSILANYITYAHAYRHASEERHKITKEEAEAYLYMTGLVMRLVIQSQQAHHR